MRKVDVLLIPDAKTGLAVSGAATQFAGLTLAVAR